MREGIGKEERDMTYADLVLINGKTFSVDLQGRVTRGEAVAVKEGTILAAGTNADIKAYVEESTEIIDCSGKTVLPGMCDAHCHPSISASAYSGCDLFGIYLQEGQTAEDMVSAYMERLKRFIKEHPEDQLIRGTGWVMGNFCGRMPTRHDIDAICSDRPVILESFCQHNLWVNTKAIQLAGLSADTPEVYAGEISREEDGCPGGLFREPEAMELIKQNVPGYDFSVEQYKEAFLYYQKEYAGKYGVTLVQDCMHSENAKEAYKELAKEGKLTLRARGVYLAEPGKASEQLAGFVEKRAADAIDDTFKIDTVKIFAEGEFALSEPYEAEFLEESGLPPEHNGALFWSDEELTKTSQEAMKAGFSIHIHAMGDKAVSQGVRCLAKAQELRRKEQGRPAEDGRGSEDAAARNVIAHLMLISEEDVKTMGREHIMANCQPRWMVHDSDIHAMIPMVGKERAKACYPYRIFLDQGVTTAFGTDFPVTPPPDTMHEIQCAMTRSVFPDAPDYETFKGKVLGAERPAELWEAVQSITINGAYQMFLEDITGSIEAGKSADLVILDGDLEAADPEEIYRIQTETTIFKGKIVYQKSK